MILFLMILFPSDFPESTGRDSQNHEEQNHGETVNGGPATITKCFAHSVTWAKAHATGEIHPSGICNPS